MIFTNVFHENRKATQRIVVNQGGTSSTKTWSIQQLLYLLAARNTLLISIVSESMPHLRRGAMRDFFKMLLEDSLYDEQSHNKTNNTYKIKKSTIEFFSVDSQDKVRGARRDILFMNECNNISYDTYSQLEVRTKERIYLDYNPVSEFWVHEKLLPLDNVKFIKSTYLDALEVLPDGIVKSIESRKETDPNWWRVYGLGEVGTLEGIIYKNYKIVDNFPDDVKWMCYGLDFGYTNDPTVLLKIAMKEDEIYIDELIYETGLTNQDIVLKQRQLEIGRRDEIYADSAEPKSIEEIYREKFNIKPCKKGKDSVNQGIDVVKRHKINITKRSINTIKEIRNYSWQKDKEGKFINKPIDHTNHAMSALRYGVSMKLKKKTGVIVL